MLDRDETWFSNAVLALKLVHALGPGGNDEDTKIVAMLSATSQDGKAIGSGQMLAALKKTAIDKRLRITGLKYPAN